MTGRKYGIDGVRVTHRWTVPSQRGRAIRLLLVTRGARRVGARVRKDTAQGRKG